MWFGGGAGIVTTVERDSTGVGPNTYGASAQAELGYRAQSGSTYFRLDWDLQLGSNDAAKVAAGYPYYPPWTEIDDGVKIGIPEWAMVQLDFDPIKLRLGIVTHAIGLEDWDSWNTYFPSKSTTFNLVPGRMGGVEVAYVLGSGYELTAFAGCDFDWGGCIPYDEDGDGENDIEAGDGFTVGAGVTTSQDFYGTWSGIAAYPTLPYYVGVLALELYPLEELWIAVDGATGIIGGEDEAGNSTNNFFLSGGLTANVLPEEIVYPMFRFQGLIDPDDGAWGGGFPKISVGAGLSSSPVDGFKISVEGKVSSYGELSPYGVDIVPGFYTSITLIRPEPPPFSAKYEEEEEAAPEAPAAPVAPGPPESGWLRPRLAPRSRHVAAMHPR